MAQLTRWLAAVLRGARRLLRAVQSLVLRLPSYTPQEPPRAEPPLRAGEELDALARQSAIPEDEEGVGGEHPQEDQHPLGTTRRRFLAGLTVLAGGGIGTLVAAPVLGFLLWPLFREEPPVWRDVGPVDDFGLDDTVPVSFADPSPQAWAGVTADSAAYLRRVDPEGFIAFSIYCTHQGCQVRWLAEPRLFMCPCHGGVFHRDGSVAAGPPPGPLVRHPVRVRDGRVEIQTRPLPVGEGVLMDELDEAPEDQLQ